jgi:choline-phosphate cytidylyltransferase
LAGKHLICNLAYISDEEKLKELFKLAQEKKVLICENIIVAYLKAFDQLLWFINGNMIGNIVSLNFKISQNNFESGRNDTRVILYQILFIIQRIMGDSFKKNVDFKEEKGRYESIYAFTESAEVLACVGITIELEDSMEIIGTKGRVYIPEEWWKIQYFKVKDSATKKVNRYSYNFEGTGFRYILMDMLSMLEAGRSESCKIFAEESLRTNRLMSSFKTTDEI